MKFIKIKAGKYKSDVGGYLIKKVSGQEWKWETTDDIGVVVHNAMTLADAKDDVERKVMKTLTTAKFVCPNCKKETVQTFKHNIHGYSDSCDTCGSHGNIFFNFRCTHCKFSMYVSLSDW